MRPGVPFCGFVVGIAALLAPGCGGGDAESTATGTAVATQDQQGQTTTIVPGVTKGTETAVPTETPGPPVGPPSVQLADAFPGLPDLERPVELIAADGREHELLVALQDGQIVSLMNVPDEPDEQVALDIRDRVSRDGNEEGLLGMTIPVEDLTSDSGRIFVYYSVAGGERRGRLARMEWSRSTGRLVIDPDSEFVILEVAEPFSNHNGGKILFGTDGYLYLGLGDGGSGGDPQGNGQNTSTLLGTILRIDVSNSSEAQRYTIPADNPFAGDANARGEIWAYGLRNPWRFSFDAQGRLWAGDVGQGNYEEIDLIERGGNYGWNVVEGNDCYQAANCDMSGFTAPVSVYDHSGGDCSVTGGVVHAAKDTTVLQGWYFFADFCSGRVRAFNPDAAETETYIVIEDGPPISDIAQVSRGVMLLSFDGRIYRSGGRVIRSVLLAELPWVIAAYVRSLPVAAPIWSV